MNESVRTILSGPAGGAVGAYEIGKMAGYSKLISFDMGGTSTDVSLIVFEQTITDHSSKKKYNIRGIRITVSAIVRQ